MAVIVLTGPSGSGKSTIEKGFQEFANYKKIVSYTTRHPRENEIDGEDYHFISDEQFEKMKINGLFAEYDEYSQDRKYGTLKADYNNEFDSVVVLTPNGLRKVQMNCPDTEIYSVLINASLGTRMIRYIDRCGSGFNYDDKNELCARVERDYGMFLGMENEVNYVLNNDNNETPIQVLVDIIFASIINYLAYRAKQEES